MMTAPIKERYRTLPTLYRFSDEYVKQYIIPDEVGVEALRRIRPFIYKFCLSDDSHKRFEDVLDGKLTDDQRWLDQVFELDSQRRAWFKLPADFLLETTFDRYTYFLQQYGVFKSLSHTELTRIFEFDTFKKGYFKDSKGNSRKLHAFLRKKVLSNYCWESFFRAMLAQKPSKQLKYLVISRNPIDYLFCSTGQSFSSCLSLDSDYEGATYLGLPSFVVDPNRFLMFLTDGRTKTYENRHGFRSEILKQYQRSWGLVGPQGFQMLKSYPSRREIFTLALKKLGYPTYPSLEVSMSIPEHYFFGKFLFKILSNQEGYAQHGYLDSLIGLTDIQVQSPLWDPGTPTAGYSNKGVVYAYQVEEIPGRTFQSYDQDGWIQDYNFESGFWCISELRDLDTNNTAFCSFCDQEVARDFVRKCNGYIVCRNCSEPQAVGEA